MQYKNHQPPEIPDVVKMLEGQDEKLAETERKLDSWKEETQSWKEETQRKLDLILAYMEKKG